MRTLTRRDVLHAFVFMESIGLVTPARDMDEAAVEASAAGWLSILGDLTPDEFERAIVLYARSGARWWPAAGELLRFVPRLQGPAEGEADAAWGELLQLIRRYGIYTPPPDEPSPAARWTPHDLAVYRRIEPGVRALGGWQQACQMDLTNAAADRASFRSALTGARREEGHRQIAARPSLRLIHDADAGQDA
jgi:hypothetical protein